MMIQPWIFCVWLWGTIFSDRLYGFVHGGYLYTQYTSILRSTLINHSGAFDSQRKPWLYAATYTRIVFETRHAGRLEDSPYPEIQFWSVIWIRSPIMIGPRFCCNRIGWKVSTMYRFKNILSTNHKFDQLKSKHSGQLEGVWYPEWRFSMVFLSAMYLR